ncbi:MAG TPA: hypothetical protein DCL41_03695 [Bdellovibrionales bacterium]|nr:hypothetical protein [Bdellovibrionales bacterium]
MWCLSQKGGRYFSAVLLAQTVPKIVRQAPKVRGHTRMPHKRKLPLGASPTRLWRLKDSIPFKKPSIPKKFHNFRPLEPQA